MDIGLRSKAMALHARVCNRFDGPVMLLSVEDDPAARISPHKAFLVRDGSVVPIGYRVYLLSEKSQPTSIPANAARILIPSSLSYLGAKDIIRIDPVNGEIYVLFRASSPSNSILLTERCNSWCVMCSQPPKQHDDSWIVEEWLHVIPWIPKTTTSIGITGGEPTLLGKKFLDVISALGHHLPDTAVQILSNGRNFAYLSFAKALAAINHPSVVVAIPLYSDIAWRHEFVVQAPRSFDQTVRGILNLARCRIPLELRVVLHRSTVPRLTELATYIVRNFPFVSHVALMGIEHIAFARANYDSLWIDPIDYSCELATAVDILDKGNLQVSVYNHQLCTLPVELWPFSVKSISDWKNIYLEQCNGCDLRDRCGGFFHSANEKHSSGISPKTISI